VFPILEKKKRREKNRQYSFIFILHVRVGGKEKKKASLRATFRPWRERKRKKTFEYEQIFY